jgi:hypothetical protein
MAKEKSTKPAWVTMVSMGLGHMRAAYPLKDIAEGGLVQYATRETTSPREFKVWDGMEKLYNFMSKAEKIPVIGWVIFAILNAAEKVLPFYPKKDYSAPNFGTKFLNGFIQNRGIGTDLIKLVRSKKLPVVSTYFANAIAIDEKAPDIKPNYLVVCDTDINRGWVGMKPQKSAIICLSPCVPSTKRLLSYGVRPEKIIETGFPLPKENLGSEGTLEILRTDLWNRLLRLDPNRVFFRENKKVMDLYYKGKSVPAKKPDHLTLMFAVGGAGAQYEMVEEMLPKFKDKLKSGKMSFVLSAGKRVSIIDDLKKYCDKIGLGSQFGKNIRGVADKDVTKYLDRFSKELHNCDVLWTKPSELVFYAGLAIPILTAPPIGGHEEFNKQWLIDLGAGVDMTGPMSAVDEWFWDLHNEGRFAWAAWNGFLRVPHNGTFVIEKLMRTGKVERTRF